MAGIRHLVVVFGDQLNRDASALDGFDPRLDRVWMAESGDEATQVWNHKQRIALFFAAMRHYRQSLQTEGIQVIYHELGSSGSEHPLSHQLSRDIQKLKPQKVILTRPGEWRVLHGVEQVCRQSVIPLELREDSHFFTTPDEFRRHADGRKQVRMEFFYRELRQRENILMESGKPVGGEWNFDKLNRASFGRSGPDNPGRGPDCPPDEITREVLAMVAHRFAGNPGSLTGFAWPVTPESARKALADFICERLANFGHYQDAMWRNEPWLYHAHISAALNLKLLNPREAIAAAVNAWQQGQAPLAAVEGFVRQILGWREYVRGIYWLHMPEYLERNSLLAQAPLPDFYWDGDTPLECLRQTIGQTLEYGYAHHIQRLMVTGLYALLLGVNPESLHEWYLAVYVDAVEWVELPNTLGMSQYADGGLMASKPYVASGAYINRMSNYCAQCPKNPKHTTGADACPFTVLYWDFLLRHQQRLSGNVRMRMQLRNLQRLPQSRRDALRKAADKVRQNPACR